LLVDPGSSEVGVAKAVRRVFVKKIDADVDSRFP